MMFELKRHTPQGVSDYMPEECAAKKDIEKKMQEAFLSYAYRMIQTPTIEYHSIYTDTTGDISSEKLFKFFDKDGRILALRGDVTTSIARVMGTKWGDNPLPARLCYVSEAFRYNGNASAMPSEFTQAGIELVGESGIYADAEIIIVTIKALLNAGLDEFQIDIGQVEFFKGLAEQMGLTQEDSEKVRILIDFKDSLSIAELASKYDADPEIKNLLCMMPELFGDAEILKKVDSEKLNKRSKAAIENLKGVYEIIKASGLSKYVSIDLGMLQSIDYYTGVIFKGVTYDVGFAVCGGGRYDSLIGGFGRDLSAVGMAISVNRVLVAMQRQKKTLYTAKVDAVMFMGENFADAIKVSDMLRSMGYILQNAYENIEDAEKKAAEIQAECVICAKSDSIVQILKDGKVTEKSVYQLLKEGF